MMINIEKHAESQIKGGLRALFISKFKSGSTPESIVDFNRHLKSCKPDTKLALDAAFKHDSKLEDIRSKQKDLISDKDHQ